MKSRITKILLTTLLLGGIFNACSSEEQKVESSNEAAVNLETEVVQNITSTSLLTYSGEIRSTSRVQIATKLMGEIESIPFDIGEKFKKGDVILRVKPDQVLANKAQAEAAVNEAEIMNDQAKRDYERFKVLFENESASLREWENAQNQLESSKARLKQAEAALVEVEDLLSFTIVKASSSGSVASKYKEVGDLSAPGQPILDIENAQSFKINFTVPESAVNRLSVGDSIGVKIPVISNNVFGAEISKLNGSGNMGNRQFEVEANLLVENLENLRSGMFADVLVQDAANEGIFISEQAVVKRGQLTGVYVVNDENRILLRWIRTGNQVGAHIEVLSGLSEGEVIVSNPNPALKDGLTIANL